VGPGFFRSLGRVPLSGILYFVLKLFCLWDSKRIWTRCECGNAYSYKKHKSFKNKRFRRETEVAESYELYFSVSSLVICNQNKWLCWI